MALATRLTTLVVNAQADVLAKLLDGGFVDVMDGRQPDSADEAITTQTVLVTMSLGSPAFLGAVGGTIAANPLGPGIAQVQGDPTWFRAYRSDHRTPVFDGSAGRKDTNMILPVKTLVAGLTVGCSGLTHTVAKMLTGN